MKVQFSSAGAPTSSLGVCLEDNDVALPSSVVNPEAKATLRDPAVLQVFHCTPANSALYPKVPTSEDKLQASGQMESPLSPGLINGDPAVLSVLSLPPDRKMPEEFCRDPVSQNPSESPLGDRRCRTAPSNTSLRLNT
ncbi:hypothetical protein AAVH_15726, partial [Aphelenchoides avenae]